MDLRPHRTKGNLLTNEKHHKCTKVNSKWLHTEGTPNNQRRTAQTKQGTGWLNHYRSRLTQILAKTKHNVPGHLYKRLCTGQLKPRQEPDRDQKLLSSTDTDRSWTTGERGPEQSKTRADEQGWRSRWVAEVKVMERRRDKWRNASEWLQVKISRETMQRCYKAGNIHTWSDSGRLGKQKYKGVQVITKWWQLGEWQEAGQNQVSSNSWEQWLGAGAWQVRTQKWEHEWKGVRPGECWRKTGGRCTGGGGRDDQDRKKQENTSRHNRDMIKKRNPDTQIMTHITFQTLHTAPTQYSSAHVLLNDCVLVPFMYPLCTRFHALLFTSTL